MSGNGEEAVREAVQGFYDALNGILVGDITPMESVWSDAEDVTYMGPFGDYRVGWADVRESWLEQTAMRLGGDVEPSEIKLNIAGELAIVHNLEVGHVFPKGNDKPVHLRATNMFRLEFGRWKMIGHHADRLP